MKLKSKKQILEMIKSGKFKLRFNYLNSVNYEFCSGTNKFIETVSFALGGESEYISQNKMKKYISEMSRNVKAFCKISVHLFDEDYKIIDTFYIN